MADSAEDNAVWQRKYSALKVHCQEIEQENEQIVNRLYHVKKLLQRYRRQRRLITEKLDEHDDDYRSVADPFQVQLQEEIRAEGVTPFERPVLLYEHSSPIPPPHPGVATTTFKKGRGRGAAKQDKEKDPNAPKRPANAFFMYCQQQRTVMQEDQKDPNMGHHELTKCLAKEWNNLEEDEKKVYYDMYERDKERYEEEMKRYSSDKHPKKDAPTKKRRSKAPKEKGNLPAYAPSPAISESSSVYSSMVVSPTLHPLSPPALNSMPFACSMPHIVSPRAEVPSFGDFDQLTPNSHESFGL